MEPPKHRPTFELVNLTHSAIKFDSEENLVITYTISDNQHIENRTIKI